MNIVKMLVILGGIATGTAAAAGIYKAFFVKKEKRLFATEKPQRRNITQAVRATGYLETEDLLKIGSIVPGIIKKLCVEENEYVKKGDVLAIIDDGKDDTEVRETEGALEEAQAALVYTTVHYQRQKTLFDVGQLSKDNFDKVVSDYDTAKAHVKSKQAAYECAKLTFTNKTIRSPQDGLIIEKISTEGETVTLASPATIIYTLAKDIRTMDVKLEIDENRVGQIKKGLVATLTFDTYPYKKFSGTIADISNAPIKKQTAVNYHATFTIDNKELLLRPGMTVNAHIVVAEKDNVITVPGGIFAINDIILEEVAKASKYLFKPMTRQAKKELEKKGAFKTVWLVEDKAFVEKPVELGINDNAFFEIVSGLTADEDIIVDVEEPDTMQQLYSKIFSKGL